MQCWNDPVVMPEISKPKLVYLVASTGGEYSDWYHIPEVIFLTFEKEVEIKPNSKLYNLLCH